MFRRKKEQVLLLCHREVSAATQKMFSGNGRFSEILFLNDHKKGQYLKEALGQWEVSKIPGVENHLIQSDCILVKPLEQGEMQL